MRMAFAGRRHLLPNGSLRFGRDDRWGRRSKGTGSLGGKLAKQERARQESRSYGRRLRRLRRLETHSAALRAGSAPPDGGRPGGRGKPLPNGTAKATARRPTGWKPVPPRTAHGRAHGSAPLRLVRMAFAAQRRLLGNGFLRFGRNDRRGGRRVGRAAATRNPFPPPRSNRP